MPPYPIVSDVPEIQAEYEAMRKHGESHNMAELLAFRQGPQVHGTDAAFMRGASGGKKYISQLGKRNDPKAWVSSADDVRAVCKAKGLDSEGLVNCKYARKDVPAGPCEKYRVADDLVAKAVEQRVQQDPGLLQRRKKEEVVAETREMVSPPPGGM